MYVAFHSPGLRDPVLDCEAVSQKQKSNCHSKVSLQIYVCSSSDEFQVWLNTFINDVTKLSMEQMEEFCTTLLEKCTIEQKCFIERCLHGLMSYDFITGLPEIPVICILQYLEPETLLKCRQVCRAWNSIITNMSQLWWQFCLKKGGKVEAFNKARGTDYFHMDYIIIGTYFGEVKLWSPQDPNCHLHELTGHVNMVTSIAVHPSQQYIITSSVDGSMRLHHLADGSGWKVLLQPPDTSLSDVTYIHFLPDVIPETLRFVFGTSRYVGLAIIGHKGTVLDQNYIGPVFRYLSFANAKSDPTLFYLTSYEGHEQRPGPCLIKRFRISESGFFDEKIVHYSHMYKLDYRILAAGKRFLLLINYEGNFILLDVLRPAFVSHFKCRPTPIPTMGLPALLKKSCFGETDCLDGLCPESMRPGKTVLMTAGENSILSWKWNGDLWGDVCWHSGDVVLY
ncbi:hypothetical protein BaRGS_00016072 [Batillaria attramentaria]|uniref:F-box domain-containing protein n=1 Tax=Batillaria attramentaria TaxID=370345 RepID=A0ABD0KZB8_9CAEN